MNLTSLIVTGIGSGYSRKSPGTLGTITCIIVKFLFVSILMGAPTISWGVPFDLLIALSVTLVGGFYAQRYLVSREGSPKDPQEIVVDEWAGMLIAMAGIGMEQPVLLLTSFVLFRFFDITKLGPIGWLERLPGSLGVMADDVLAGLVTFGILSFFR